MLCGVCREADAEFAGEFPGFAEEFTTPPSLEVRYGGVRDMWEDMTGYTEGGDVVFGTLTYHLGEIGAVLFGELLGVFGTVYLDRLAGTCAVHADGGF